MKEKLSFSSLYYPIGNPLPAYTLFCQHGILLQASSLPMLNKSVK